MYEAVLCCRWRSIYPRGISTVEPKDFHLYLACLNYPDTSAWSVVKSSLYMTTIQAVIVAHKWNELELCNTYRTPHLLHSIHCELSNAYIGGFPLPIPFKVVPAYRASFTCKVS